MLIDFDVSVGVVAVFGIDVELFTVLLEFLINAEDDEVSCNVLNVLNRRSSSCSITFNSSEYKSNLNKLFVESMKLSGSTRRYILASKSICLLEQTTLMRSNSLSIRSALSLTVFVFVESSLSDLSLPLDSFFCSAFGFSLAGETDGFLFIELLVLFFFKFSSFRIEDSFLIFLFSSSINSSSVIFDMPFVWLDVDLRRESGDLLDFSVLFR